LLHHRPRHPHLLQHQHDPAPIDFHSQFNLLEFMLMVKLMKEMMRQRVKLIKYWVNPYSNLNAEYLSDPGCQKQRHFS